MAAHSFARTTALALGLVVAGATLAGEAQAVARGRSGWYHTGDGVMTTSVLFIDVDVLAVGHDMKCMPEHRSKAEVVAADCDKRFVWRALRDIDKKTIHESLRKGYKTVDYGNDAKVRRALSAFTSKLAEGTRVIISYDAAAKSTTLAPERGGDKVTVAGDDFMRATWSILFANPELGELGDALVSKL